nr:D-aminoacyl-tRNA deacylase [Maliibacterium massiliense]
MRACVQRVSRAEVRTGGAVRGSIAHGYVVLVGVETGDTQQDAAYLVRKLAALRVFEDEHEKMNRSILDVGGSILLVSQFTLLGDARHGNRPSFIRAERPAEADALFERLRALLVEAGLQVETGVFQTHMEVSLVNDGPVTILLDSKKTF